MNYDSCFNMSHNSHVSPQNLPLQPLHENIPQNNLSHRRSHNKIPQKSGKCLDLPFSENPHKGSKPSKSQENNPNLGKASARPAKALQNKQDGPPTVSLHESKSIKAKEKNEKNFKDLNKSIANLASRRFVGRSSSDNDAINYFNSIETDPNQRSQGPSNHHQHFDTPLAYNSPHTAIQTPAIVRKPNRGHQTSVHKDYDVTPFALQNQDQQRESDRLLFHPSKGKNNFSRDLTISDLDYAKFQGGGAFGKNPKAAHYLSVDPRSKAQSRNFVTEGSYRLEFSHLDNPDLIDQQTFSQFYSNEMQLSQQQGDYTQEFVGESLKEQELMTLPSSVRHTAVSQNQNQGSKNRFHKKRWSGLGYLSSQHDSGCPPSSSKSALKGNSATRGKNSNLPLKGENHPRRFSEYASNSVSQGGLVKKDAIDQLDFNHISDGVEYTMGGLGKYSHIKKKQNMRNKSSLTTTESNSRPSKFEGLESVRKETLDTWKQDIIRIRRDIETRKRSYAEVNKFVKMYEDENLPKPTRESRDNSAEHYAAARKNSNLSCLNSGNRQDKIDLAKQAYFSGMKTPGMQESAQRQNKNKKKKISFEFKTTEDCDEQRSGMIPKTEQISPGFKTRLNTVSYYEFNQETRDLNSSYAYDDQQIVFEKSLKPPCCGSGKSCNIF